MTTTPAVFDFSAVARLPEPADNAAIAIRRLEAGTRITHDGGELTLERAVMEGHRFALKHIQAGEPVLSWGLPFGLALRDIAPGGYLVNEKGLKELRHRRLDFQLPAQPNFKDHRISFTLDEAAFRPAEQVASVATPATFDGYARDGGRGVGTRNFIIVLGTSSRTASYARLLCERFKDVPSRFPNIDGVAPVAHTEGGGSTRPNNLDFTLRTLAGFIVHPNVAAVLAVDLGTEPITNAVLREFMQAHGYALDAVPHTFLSMGGAFEAALMEGEAVIRGWLESVNAITRTPQPAAHLKVALQCGGSDAFSGVSGNPLSGWVAKELIRHGGSANLAETSELIGAEPYVLAKVRDLATARKFLQQADRFQEWAGWHGHSAEGNPSGGNLYRGLYNVVIKSIGAARKKDPEVRLDYCLDYSEPMTAPGYYFMDSPGNDLESIAGQVASGCNLIHFITGNGSITNFPFVPTVKVVTTTGRFELLRNEMDVNAGRYLDGTPMEELGRETFGHTLRIASGERSVGEKAGHSQVQLWRDWRQTDGARLEQIEHRPKPTGEPIAVNAAYGEVQARRFADATFTGFATGRSVATDQVGLIVPTSLCAGQIAQMIAGRLNSEARGKSGVTRYVALPHTEGCGVSRGESEVLYMRTMTGYLRHPFAKRALLLEHGCEKTHNDEMRAFLAEQGVDMARFGTASIQLDGGIDAVTKKVVNWFLDAPDDGNGRTLESGLGALRLGLAADSDVPAHIAEALGQTAAAVVAGGGTVVVPADSALLKSPSFSREWIGDADVRATLDYGEPAMRPGLHIMETPTDHFVEALTGLGATGVEMVLACSHGAPLQGHPLVPLLQMGGTAPDLPCSGSMHADDVAAKVVELLMNTAAGRYAPKAWAQGNTDFQVTRGWVGVSL